MSTKSLMIISFVVPFLIRNIVGIFNLLSYKTTSDPEKYRYTFRRFQISFIESTISIGLLISFVFFDVFLFVDILIGTYIKVQIIHSLIYIELFVIILTMLKIPFQYYRKFVIEKEFDLNRSSKKLFFFDNLKSLLIQIIISSIVIFTLFKIYDKTSNNFWWITCLFLVSIQIVFYNIYSTVFVPMFNKKSDIESAEHKREILKLTKKLVFNARSIEVINQSKRSKNANAYFAGLGKNKRIILYDNIISLLTPKELTAIVAHEIGHNRIKQFYLDLCVEVIKMSIILFLFQVLSQKTDIFLRLGFSEGSFHISVVILFILLKPFLFIYGIFENIYFRFMEYKADKYAVTNYNGVLLQDSLVKISDNNLLNQNPLPLYEFLFYAHPSINNRIKRIKSLINKNEF